MILASAAWAKTTAAKPSDLDCCVYAHRALQHRYALPDPPDHIQALWCIWSDDSGAVDAERVWGPPIAAVEEQISDHIMPEPLTERRWYLCQGWRTLQPDGRAIPALGDAGHTWLWLHLGAGGLGVRVDSSRADGARIHGWDRWSSLRARYAAGIRCALLHRRRP